MKEPNGSENNQELAETIKVAREGDLSAFERLVSMFERRVFGYVSRHVSNREDAEDITQDVFIKLYKKIGTYNPAQSFTTWLFTIATNTIYDHLRKKRGKTELLIIDDPVMPLETEDPKDTYTPVEAAYDVEQALSKIKPGYRTVLLLFYRDQLSVAEIANILKAPVGTIKTQLHRARLAVKNAFK